MFFSFYYYYYYLLVVSVKGNSTSNGSSAEEKSDAGKGKRCLGANMVLGILLWVFTSSHLLFYV